MIKIDLELLVSKIKEAQSMEDGFLLNIATGKVNEYNNRYGDMAFDNQLNIHVYDGKEWKKR